MTPQQSFSTVWDISHLNSGLLQQKKRFKKQKHNMNESDLRSDMHYLGSSENKA